MDERQIIESALSKLEGDLEKLKTLFEQYFAGVEKREPMQNREDFARSLRQFVNRRIIQTDLRQKYQNIAFRYHSYSNYWDRILREIDEGRYIRHKRPQTGRPPIVEKAPPTDIDKIYNQLLKARKDCGTEGKTPSKRQVEAFLEEQKKKIRAKFGDMDVEFAVVPEGGKPKIKVRAKR